MADVTKRILGVIRSSYQQAALLEEENEDCEPLIKKEGVSEFEIPDCQWDDYQEDGSQGRSGESDDRESDERGIWRIEEERLVQAG